MRINVATVGDGWIVANNSGAIYREDQTLDFGEDHDERYRPIPAPGSMFNRWEGLCGNQYASCAITFTEDLWSLDVEADLRAHFADLYSGPLVLYAGASKRQGNVLLLKVNRVHWVGVHHARGRSRRLYVTDANRHHLVRGIKRDGQYRFNIGKLDKHTLDIFGVAVDTEGYLASVSMTLNEPVPTLAVAISYADYPYTASHKAISDTFFAKNNSVDHFYNKNSGGIARFVPIQENDGTPNDGVIRVTIPQKYPLRGKTYDSPIFTDIAQAVLNKLNRAIDFSQYDRNGDGYVEGDELAVVLVSPKDHSGKKFESGFGFITFDGAMDGIDFHMLAFAFVHDTRYAAPYTIIAHELGHTIHDLPDLYDLDGSSEGVSEAGLMGWGGKANFIAWSRADADFVAPVLPDRKKGDVFLPFGDNAAPFKLQASPYGGKEYFLLEARRKSGTDRLIESPGLLITHIDDSQYDWRYWGRWNGNDEQRLVDVEGAFGGELDLGIQTSDDLLFPGSSGQTAFTRNTIPSSATYHNPNKSIAVWDIRVEEKGIRFKHSAPLYPYSDRLTRRRKAIIDYPLGYQQRSLVIRYGNTRRARWIEGIEIGLEKKGPVNIGIYRRLEAGVPIEPLYQASNVMLKAGIHPLMLDHRVNIADLDAVYVSIESATPEHLWVYFDATAEQRHSLVNISSISGTHFPPNEPVIDLLVRGRPKDMKVYAF